MMAAFDWVIPVIFLLVWAANKLFGAGGSEDSEAPHAPDAGQRTREIQEEIRRRIADRQGPRETPRAAPPRPPPLRKTAPLLRTPAPQPVFRGGASPFTTPVEVQPPPLSPRPAERNLDLQVQLAEQMERLRDTRLEAGMGVTSGKMGTARRRGKKRAVKVTAGALSEGSKMRRDVLKALRETGSSRKKAFLYAEVVGAPVSMRRDNGFMQFWEQ